MKIIAYGVRKDELEYFEKFAEQFGIEYATTAKELNAETVKLAKGFDAVSVYTAHEETNEAWSKLEEFGIKYFSVRTTGYDAIDFEKANKHNMKISNVPQYSPNAIAEYAVAMTLSALRKIPLALDRAKIQNFSVDGLIGKELNQMTIGIIGTGCIGLTTAKVFKAFGSKVIAYDVVKNEQAAGVLTYEENLNDLFAKADVISLHIPLAQDNKHLINAESIKQMKDGVVIINTARGAHVDSAALRDALVSGKVSAAGLDVYEFEDNFIKKDLSGQVIDDGVYRDLANLPNVMMTPHVAFNTDVAVRNMVKMSTENLINFFNAGVCDNEIKK